MINFLRISVLLVFGFHSAGFAQKPYDISRGDETILLSSGVSLSLLAFVMDSKVQPLTKNEIYNLNRNDVNWFDRSASFNYSSGSITASDILLSVTAATPLLLYLSPAVRKDAAEYTFMLAEVMMFTYSFTHIVKGSVRRIRPYAYNVDAPEDLKMNEDTRKSFFSGHASISFASAMFVSETFAAYNPDSEYKGSVRAGALLLAAATSYLRYSAGKHFPTDILTGAIVGSAIGYCIPLLHKSDSGSQVSFGPYMFGVTVPL